MVNCLYCLRHDAIISCNHNNGNVGDLSATGTHCGKRLMTGSIKKCYLSSVIKLHTVGPYMLSNSSGLPCNHVSSSYIIEQLCLTMVNMTHYSYNWRSVLKLIGCINFLFDSFLKFSAYKFNL